MNRTLFMISGSIAAFKACQVISRLVQKGEEVEVAVTPSALKFVGAATLEGLTGRAVFDDLWCDGRVMDHIALTRWADRAVLCPASAQTVARLALGLADDPVSTLALAWPMAKPFHIFPAMNTRMFEAEPTRAHLAALRARGFRVAAPAEGNLACGEVGAGRLPEPDDILRAIDPQACKGRVLITAGATREHIDGIRFVSNVSTGRTASEVADQLVARGWQVTYLHGPGAMTPQGAADLIEFTDFRDLRERLGTLMGTDAWTGVVHAAAVGDYSVANPLTDGKLSGDQSEMIIRLKPNPKLLPLIKELARDKTVKVIGFKLTLNESDDQTLAKARALLGPTVDAVVGNDWAAVRADRTRHPGQFVTNKGAEAFARTHELAARIDAFLSHEGGPS